MRDSEVLASHSDLVGCRTAFQDGRNILDTHHSHFNASAECGGAEVREKHHLWQRAESGRHVGFVFVHVQSRPSESAFLDRGREGMLIYDGPA